MENKFLIDLSVKYDLNSEELSKLVSVVHQVGHHSTEDQGFKQAAAYVCEMKLLDLPGEEVVEELKRKKLDADSI